MEKKTEGKGDLEIWSSGKGVTNLKTRSQVRLPERR